jgi:crotonobetainyl-CoA:carnitine CoA-transferase CaiB-like acyl-CoA transferase
VIENRLQSFDASAEPISVLQDNAIMCAPVLDVGEAMRDPQMAARGAMQEIVQPGFGPVALPRSPFHCSHSPVRIPGPSPALGEHNAEVMEELLGYSRETVEQLTRAGVLVQPPPDAPKA